MTDRIQIYRSHAREGLSIANNQKYSRQIHKMSVSDQSMSLNKFIFCKWKNHDLTIVI